MSNKSPEQKAMVQALQYAKISNFIDNEDILLRLANGLTLGTTKPGEIKTKLNEILDTTTIKRACCMGRAGPPDENNNTGVEVKIPIPKDYDMASESNEYKQFYPKYGFVNRTVYVPKDRCNATLQPYTDYCNRFMEGYCTNQWEVFKKLNNNDEAIAGANFPKYLPECGCFGRINPSYPSGIPRLCYMEGCLDAAKSVYLDGSSRESGGKAKDCKMVQCNSVINFADITAGKNINIEPKIQNQCGDQIKSAQDQAAQNKAAADKKAADDKAAADKKAADDKAAADKLASDRAAAEKAAADKAAADAAAAAAAAAKAEADRKAAEKAAADAAAVAASKPNDQAAQNAARAAQANATAAANNANAANNAAKAADAQAELAKKKAEEAKNSGMPMGLIIGIVVLLLIICGAGIYFATRKSTAPVSVPQMVPQ